MLSVIQNNVEMAPFLSILIYPVLVTNTCYFIFCGLVAQDSGKVLVPSSWGFVGSNPGKVKSLSGQKHRSFHSRSPLVIILINNDPPYLRKVSLSNEYREFIGLVFVPLPHHSRAPLRNTSTVRCTRPADASFNRITID